MIKTYPNFTNISYLHAIWVTSNLCCLDFPTHFPIRLLKLLLENICIMYILEQYNKQTTHKENKPKG